MQTPAHLASKKGHCDVLRCLAEHNADLNERSTDGMVSKCSATPPARPRLHHTKRLVLRLMACRCAVLLRATRRQRTTR